MKKGYMVFLFFFSQALFAQNDYIRLNAPNNGWSTNRIVTIKGETNVSVKTVTINYNGIVFLLPVINGAFQRDFIAAPGINTILARVLSGAKSIEDKVQFYSKAPAKNLKIILVWDTDNTDVDLWVTEPSGEKCFYSYQNTKIGGSLDIDVTNGFGPEVYTLAQAKKGSYLIQVNYYSDNAVPQSQGKVYVIQDEGLSNEIVREYEIMLTKTGEIITVASINYE
jgi:uncharacterized protein YfaP (DUF2135 family)